MLAVGGVTVAVVAAAVIVGVSVGGSDDNTDTYATDSEFNQFCATYGISFESQSEYNFRKTQYDTIGQEIQRINSDSTNTWTASHNPTSIMTNTEYQSLLGFIPDTTTQA